MKRLTYKQIPEYREAQLDRQEGVDPITMRPVDNPCLDHDHVTGHVRQVLDRDTNAFEGKVFNAWRRYLRYKGVPLARAIIGLLDYYGLNYSDNPLHPSWRTEDDKRILRNKRAKRRRRAKKGKR